MLSLARWAALQVPSIRRLRDQRNQLLAEVDALRHAAAQPPPEPARVDPAPLDPPSVDPMPPELRAAMNEQRLIITDYGYRPRERDLATAASGRQLAARFAREAPRYAATLRDMSAHFDGLRRVPFHQNGPLLPYWDNDWFSPFDGTGLYG